MKLITVKGNMETCKTKFFYLKMTWNETEKAARCKRNTFVKPFVFIMWCVARFGTICTI